MNKKELEKIKNILKTYRNIKKYSNEEMAEHFGVKRSTMVGYIQKNRGVSKVFLNKFIKEEDIIDKDKKIILEYLVKSTPKTNKKKSNLNVEEKLNEILYLLCEKDGLQETKNINRKKANINIEEKRDEVLNYIEKNKDDYLKFMETLKIFRKNISELDYLSFFNTKIKSKSKKEIVKILEKSIKEIKEIQKKILEEEIIVEVIDVEWKKEYCGNVWWD